MSDLEQIKTAIIKKFNGLMDSLDRVALSGEDIDIFLRLGPNPSVNPHVPNIEEQQEFFDQHTKRTQYAGLAADLKVKVAESLAKTTRFDELAIVANDPSSDPIISDVFAKQVEARSKYTRLVKDIKEKTGKDVTALDKDGALPKEVLDYLQSLDPTTAAAAAKNINDIAGANSAFAKSLGEIARSKLEQINAGAAGLSVPELLKKVGISDKAGTYTDEDGKQIAFLTTEQAMKDGSIKSRLLRLMTMPEAMKNIKEIEAFAEALTKVSRVSVDAPTVDVDIERKQAEAGQAKAKQKTADVEAHVATANESLMVKDKEMDLRANIGINTIVTNFTDGINSGKSGAEIANQALANANRQLGLGLRGGHRAMQPAPEQDHSTATVRRQGAAAPTPQNNP